MSPRAKFIVRLFLLLASLAFIFLGSGDYVLLRAMVRFLCPSCIGLA